MQTRAPNRAQAALPTRTAIAKPDGQIPTAAAARECCGAGAVGRRGHAQGGPAFDPDPAEDLPSRMPPTGRFPPSGKVQKIRVGAMKDEGGSRFLDLLRAPSNRGTRHDSGVW